MSTSSAQSFGRRHDDRGGDDSLALLTVEEAAHLLRIGRNTCYELIRQRRLPHVRFGRVIRVPRWALDGWIAQEAGLPPPPPSVVSFNPQRH